MPAVPSWLIEPIWDQFQALIPPVVDTRWGATGRGSPTGSSSTTSWMLWCSAPPTSRSPTTPARPTTIRTRRDEWITAGVFAALEQLCLQAYHRIVGLQPEQITVDGCLVKAPCGGEAPGPSPVDRGKLGTKRSVMTDALGIPIGCVTAPANCHDSPLLRPTLEQLAGFETRFGVGLPDHITVHLDAGYDSAKTRDLLTELGCHGVISTKGFPLQAGARWVIERTNSWHTRGFRSCRSAPNDTPASSTRSSPWPTPSSSSDDSSAAWTTHRWDTRPPRRP